LNTFTNPINDGSDPWLVYHLTTSQGDAIRMWKSSTLAGLSSAEPIVIWQDTDPSRNQQVWAAEFHQIGERWYMYYTASDGIDKHHRLYVLESEADDPTGPYHFKGMMFDEWAIDPGLLALPDGRLYFLWTGFHDGNALFIAPLANPYTLAAPGVLISKADYEWERMASFPVNEAPEILQRNGKIFLIYSACDTGLPDYALAMLTADADADPMNPGTWVKHPVPVFTRNDAANVYGPGHNGFFKSPDGTQDWIVYHAKTVTDYTYAGRTTRAQPFTWNPDGTPNFGQPLALGIPQPEPSGTVETEPTRAD
jgi:GH43 family beta-xylosidase